ncbi:hypothetical protein [Streptomyces sp. 2R]|uniref:hypothetical protein n=1 Tax=Streptomyces sp. 2R TaxID=1883452 RepID=UPI00117BFAA6|nr:hypothetical protein [Streptomyces sp. 2R]
MTDGLRPPEPPSDPSPEDDVERKPLRRRVTDAWNKLGPASKVGAISVAAAVVGAVITVVHTRATTAEDEPDDSAGVLAEVARILNQAATEQDESSISGTSSRPPYSGPVNGYWRDQCLNPRGHADGNCTHERRWVDDYTKGLSGDDHDAEGEDDEDEWAR